METSFALCLLGFAFGLASSDYDFPLGSGEYVTVQLGRSETNGRGPELRSSGVSRMGDSSEIKFLEEEEKEAVLRQKRKEAPLRLLRTLALETDFEQIVRAYVDNVDIIKDAESGNNILVDRLGNPVKDSTGKKVVTSKSPPTLPPFRASAMKNHGKIGPTSISNHSAISLSPKGVISERLTPQLKAGVGSKLSYTSAECRPEERTVQLPVDEPNVISYPRCVRVERCGGCCGSDLLVCEPIQQATIYVDVKKFEYIGDGSSSKMNLTGVESIAIQRHTACTCNCRVKASDCSSRHEYVESDCQCKCKNAREHEKCVEDPRKIWDVSSCSCLCREIRDCNSGFGFDHVKTCECVAIPPAPTKRTRRRSRARQTNNTQ